MVIKLPVFVTVYVIVLTVVVLCEGEYPEMPRIKRDNLHSFMNDDELEYYFGPKHKRSAFQNPDYEIVNLPKNFDNDNLKLEFDVFGRPVKFNFHPNDVIVSPNIRIVRKDENEAELMLANGSSSIKNCHYLHSDDYSAAAISNCVDSEIIGILLLPNSTLEIRPLTKRLQSLIHLAEPLVSADDSSEYFESIPHIIKRAAPIDRSVFENDFNVRKNVLSKFSDEPDNVSDMADQIYQGHEKRSSKVRKYTIEIGVFFDEAGYNIFAPFFKYDDDKMTDMILAYMNGVQALYHHPSLGERIDVSIVYMEIMKRQPDAMQHYDGERGPLLDSFCDYQKSQNTKDDKDSGHWDMALYISGLDFFAYENGRKNTVTMGLATVGGVCLDQYACIIAEYGTTNSFGKPYPSAGFTSVYIMAHEMGHNLGMHHDSSGNSCPKEGYIMSPSRGFQGETIWSSCSADVITKLSYAKCLFDKPTNTNPQYDAWKYNGYPGQTWTAKRQCEVLLTDKDAYVSTQKDLGTICHNLQCRTPHRTGYYSSGPALDGTDCGNDKWCEGGSCGYKKQLPNPVTVVKGGWSPWKFEQCNSGCTLKSKGYQVKRRTCNNPKPQNTDEGCDGPSYDVSICNDQKICRPNQRKGIIEYASQRCKVFSLSLPELDQTGKGLQAPHESIRLWMGCAIFCRRADTGSYYTPRIELNDIGVDPYFPDGTWCNSDGKQNYYCMQHHCLPENFNKGKITTEFWPLGEDVPISGNALPIHRPFDGNLLKYLSVNDKGRPLLTHIGPEDVSRYNSEIDWANKDYLEIPETKLLPEDDNMNAENDDRLFENNFV